MGILAAALLAGTTLLSGCFYHHPHRSYHRDSYRYSDGGHDGHRWDRRDRDRHRHRDHDRDRDRHRDRDRDRRWDRDRYR